MANELTLYHFPKTLSTRVRWWLEEAKVPYKSITIDIRREEQDAPEFRKISPLGTIPVLIDGDLVLRESLAICLHLGFRFPDARLSPRVGTAEFSRYVQWLSFAATEAHKTVSNCVVSNRARLLGAAKTNEGSARETFLQILPLYEVQLGKSRFLAGEGVTGADLFNASLLSYADSVGLIPDSGAVRTWLDGLTALPSYKRALASAEPTTNSTTTPRRDGHN